MRVYVPTTLPALRRQVAAGELGPAPLTAFAVTPTLREWYAEGDLEALEYVAQSDAAVSSLRLIGMESGAPAQRVVLAADVPDDAVSPEPALGRAVVRLAQPVPLPRVESALVDAPEAAPDVREAVAALPACDAGDQDARFTVDGAEDHELLWYDAQEIPGLLLE